MRFFHPLAMRPRGVSQSDPMSAPPSADVSRILDKMTNAPDVLPLKSIMALDVDITDAMRRERHFGGRIQRSSVIVSVEGASARRYIERD